MSTFSFEDTFVVTVTANSEYFATIGTIESSGFKDVHLSVSGSPSCTGTFLKCLD
jgi:hypothetical protein